MDQIYGNHCLELKLSFKISEKSAHQKVELMMEAVPQDLEYVVLVSLFLCETSVLKSKNDR